MRTSVLAVLLVAVAGCGGPGTAAGAAAATPGGAPEPAALVPVAAACAPTRAPVRVRVDAAFRAAHPDGRRDVERILADAGAVLSSTACVDLAVVAYEAWEVEPGDLDEALLELERVEPGDGTALVLG